MNIEKAILPIKINELVGLVSEHKKLDSTDALSYLYSSQFYKQLLNPETKWWYMSGLILYRELEKEKKKAVLKDKTLSKEHLFTVFCAENYKAAKLLEATEVHALFQKLDVYPFLIKNFDVLHSQDENYILEEIEIYIKNRQ